MTMLPDPNSEAMGRLVDQWLVSLRKAGWSNRRLQTAVERLGSALRRGNPETAQEAQAVERFMTWWQTTRSPNTPESAPRR